jgi:hypothetical protein
MNGESGVFSEQALNDFFKGVVESKAVLYFMSKEHVAASGAVPEISSKDLLRLSKETVVGVFVDDEELCGHACGKFISYLAVIRALLGNEVSVSKLDGMENEPPRPPDLVWENVPYLLLVREGKPAIAYTSNDFSLHAMVQWIISESAAFENQSVENLLAFLDTEEGKRKFVDNISDSTLKTAVHAVLFEEDDDFDDEDNVGTSWEAHSSTSEPDEENWDDDEF